MVKNGKFIVFYGINNLGKSTQAKLLVDNLKKHNIQAEYIKYPIYELQPTGPRLNHILRSGQKQTISEKELQALYAQNRIDFEPLLRQKLNSGTWVIAEDYTGTGLAWGTAKGVDLENLLEQNKGLIIEDLALLFDGQRFMEGKESIHLHESNDALMEKCRSTHSLLMDKFGWHKVNANQSIEKVQSDIWEKVKQYLP